MPNDSDAQMTPEHHLNDIRKIVKKKSMGHTIKRMDAGVEPNLYVDFINDILYAPYNLLILHLLQIYRKQYESNLF